MKIKGKKELHLLCAFYLLLFTFCLDGSSVGSGVIFGSQLCASHHLRAR
jgi:hypothetical protein